MKWISVSDVTLVPAWKAQQEMEAFYSSSTLLPLLELPGFFVAAVTDPHRVVPAARWHGPPPLRAVVAHALATGTAVVDGEARGELSLALTAGVDVLVRDPVGRASCVFHQAWTHRGYHKIPVCVQQKHL